MRDFMKMGIGFGLFIALIGSIVAYSVQTNSNKPQVAHLEREMPKWSLQRQLDDQNFQETVRKSGVEDCIGDLESAASKSPASQDDMKAQNGGSRTIIPPLTQREKTKRLQLLRFNGNEPAGETYDNEDGTASIFANLATTDFSFDGQDLWVHMREAPDYKLHIRGKFTESGFLRIQGTVLTTLRFLDADISIVEIQKLIAPSLSATNGSFENQYISGRMGKDDFLSGGHGCDIFAFKIGSGIDTIQMDKNTDAMPDVAMFDVRLDQVIQRVKPMVPFWEGDINIELIKEVTNNDKNIRYLTGDVLVISDANSVSAGNFKSPLYFYFKGEDTFVPGVQFSDVQYFPFKRSDFIEISKLCNQKEINAEDIEVNYELIGLLMNEDRKDIRRAFSASDYDFLVFKDNEIISLNNLIEEVDGCDFTRLEQIMQGKQN